MNLVILGVVLRSSINTKCRRYNLMEKKNVGSELNKFLEKIIKNCVNINI